VYPSLLVDRHTLTIKFDTSRDVNPLALLNRRDHTVVVDYATPSTFLTCDGTLAPETPETVLMGTSLDRNQYKPTYVDGSMIQAWNNGVDTAPSNTPTGNDYPLNQYRLNGCPRQIDMRTLVENYEVCRERQDTMLNNRLGTSAAFIPPDDIRRNDVLVETSPPQTSHRMFMLSANDSTQAHNTATASTQTGYLPGIPASPSQHSNNASATFATPETIHRNQASMTGHQLRTNQSSQHVSPETNRYYSLSGPSSSMTTKINAALNSNDVTHFFPARLFPQSPSPWPTGTGPSGSNAKTAYTFVHYTPREPGRPAQASSSSRARASTLRG
jgi:hypothetical protein